jgi:histidinol-phosphate aminotransferase
VSIFRRTTWSTSAFDCGQGRCTRRTNYSGGNSRAVGNSSEFAGRCRGRIRLLRSWLVNPHNPTGTVIDADELKQFVRDISSRALVIVIVIVDEANLEFADALSRRTLASLVHAGDNVIVFRTFAKIYGLAGLDIGYGLVPQRIAQALKQRDLDNPHLLNRLAVAAAAASLADTHYVSAVATTVAHERQIWLELLRELQVSATSSQGNFIFFETGFAHADFSAALLAQGIDIGRSFPPYDHWARISIGLAQENALARTAVRKLLANPSLNANRAPGNQTYTKSRCSSSRQF